MSQDVNHDVILAFKQTLKNDTAAASVPVRPVTGRIHPIMQAAIEPFTRQPHTSSAGPATSQDAGDQHTDSGKRLTNAMRVLRLVYCFANAEATATLLAMRCPLTLTEVRRRLTDLQALDYVEKGDRRGREFTWRITTAGLLELSKHVGRLAR